MKTIKGLVSIIVPCYNQGDFLCETLDSILSQTFNDWECIIINDGSNDNTEEIALSYCNKDSRFYYLYQVNQGVIAARNNAIRQSRGEYILPLDGDDLITPTYIEKAVAVIEHDHNIKLVYCNVEYIGDKTGIVPLPPYSPSTLLEANCFTNTSMFRREDFDRVGGYNPNMQYGYEDWDFWISILEGSQWGEVFKLDFTGFYYRIIDKNTSRNKTALDYRTVMHRQVFINHPNSYYDDYLKRIAQYNKITQSRMIVYLLCFKRIIDKLRGKH